MFFYGKFFLKHQPVDFVETYNLGKNWSNTVNLKFHLLTEFSLIHICLKCLDNCQILGEPSEVTSDFIESCIFHLVNIQQPINYISWFGGQFKERLSYILCELVLILLLFLIEHCAKHLPLRLNYTVNYGISPFLFRGSLLVF